MAFVQIIEFRTSQLDDMRRVEDEWERAARQTQDSAASSATTVTTRTRYFEVVFFDSYQDAMQNSALPETDALSKKMLGFANGPATFYNLDVEDDRSG